MDELKKLVQIIYKRGSVDSILLDFKNKKPNKEWLLFEGLADGSINTNSQALEKLYTSSDSEAGIKMVKSRLKRKLLNQLFFLNLHDKSSKTSHAQEHECYAKLYQARVLINNGAYDLSLPLIKEALGVAQQFEFIDIIYLCLRSLLHAHANLGNKLAFQKVSSQIEETYKLLEADQESEKLFLEAKVELSHSISSRKKYLLVIDKVLARMEALWAEFKTFDTFYNYYRLMIWSQELKGDFNRIVEITNISQNLLETNKINADRFDHRFNKYIQVYSHLRAKKLEEGIELASTYSTSFNPSSNNWFAFMENYFLLVLHAKRYNSAHLLIHQVNTNPFIKKINKMAQERWYLFEAYLQFVSPQSDTTFNWQGFLQNVPSYSKDKEGYNVAILILRVMYHIHTADFESLDYRMEALKKYAHKHFKDSFSERSRTFFKLLAIMVQHDFDPMVIQKKGLYLFQKLQRLIPPGDAYAEIEIIPYEHLWELIIERLQAVENNRFKLD